MPFIHAHHATVATVVIDDRAIVIGNNGTIRIEEQCTTKRGFVTNNGNVIQCHMRAAVSVEGAAALGTGFASIAARDIAAVYFHNTVSVHDRNFFSAIADCRPTPIGQGDVMRARRTTINV